MYLFVVSFVLFYALVSLRYQSSIKPALIRLGVNKVQVPNRLVESWLIVTATLFPLNSVLRARRSDYDLKESMSFLALILGVILGLVADVSTGSQ